jgi:hypothetical protein
MFCSHCGHQQKDNAKFCHNCGTSNSSALPQPTSPTTTKNDARILDFYVVPTSKFLILSVLTFGTYIIFWFAKNWIIVKKQENSLIHPIARAIFNIFFFSSLAERILKSAKARGYDRNYYSVLLAIGYFLLSLLFRLDDGWALLGFTSILTFIPLLEAIKFNNEKSTSRINNYGKYRTGEIVAMILGGLWWILVLIGLSS